MKIWMNVFHLWHCLSIIMRKNFLFLNNSHFYHKKSQNIFFSFSRSEKSRKIFFHSYFQWHQSHKKAFLSPMQRATNYSFFWFILTSPLASLLHLHEIFFALFLKKNQIWILFFISTLKQCIFLSSPDSPKMHWPYGKFEPLSAFTATTI